MTISDKGFIQSVLDSRLGVERKDPVEGIYLILVKNGVKIKKSERNIHPVLSTFILQKKSFVLFCLPIATEGPKQSRQRL